MPDPSGDDERFLRLALAACREGVDRGQAPFGACIVRSGEVLATAHNRVWVSGDPTAHAEVEAIRAACRAVGAIELEGATAYSTTEPCPMCFAALHWARVGRIVSGARIEDAARVGFRELAVSNRTLRELGGLEVEVVPDLLRAEAVAELERWRDLGRSPGY